MKILITAATEMEIALLKKQVVKNSVLKKHVLFQVTDIGMTATAYNLAKSLYKHPPDLAINIGVAGSFQKNISIGEVVHVTCDCFADLGAESENNFLTLAEIGLQKKNQAPFRNGKLVNVSVKKYPALKSLKQVNSITVNTVHGNNRSIRNVIRKFNPDIESMEGAAFFYVCMMEKIPGIQLRAISNYVERRNKNNWNIPLALNNLTKVTLDFLRAAY